MHQPAAKKPDEVGHDRQLHRIDRDHGRHIDHAMHRQARLPATDAATSGPDHDRAQDLPGGDRVAEVDRKANHLCR